MARPQAPKNVGERARRFWRHVVNEYDPDEDDLVVLVETVRTMDECDRLRESLDDNGMMVSGSKGQPVVNPAVNALARTRNTLDKLLQRLNLSEDEGETWAQTQAREAAQERWRLARRTPRGA